MKRLDKPAYKPVQCFASYGRALKEKNTRRAKDSAEFVILPVREGYLLMEINNGGKKDE